MSVGGMRLTICESLENAKVKQKWKRNTKRPTSSQIGRKMPVFIILEQAERYQIRDSARRCERVKIITIVLGEKHGSVKIVLETETDCALRVCIYEFIWN